jgi:poly-gamma-glutamate capsule biosynthesis protein CapA/YwtB (metallophosphatase superfamily)
MTRNEISLFLAGDALIIRPWSHVRETRFLGLVGEIRAAGVAVANLETVIHEFKGYAQADSGGTYTASPPQIAAELKWAGFDMLAHANNHTFDYGTSGVLETIEHAEKAGLILAGSGKDLQDARAPRYFRCDEGTVSLVSMASDFVSYGKASKSRPDLHGRPGVNPLTVTEEHRIPMPALIASPFRAVARRIGLKRSFVERASSRLGVRFHSVARMESADLQANLDAVAEGASKADVVVASIHAHRQGAWLGKFARQTIERGAGVVFVHGPHHVRGIELYRGKPIFYSMGNFVYETEHITRFPAETYERLGLAPDATLSDLQRVRDELPTGLLRERQTFEGFVASISISVGKVTRIRLIPTDLQFDSDGESRGRPQLASPELGRRILQTVAGHSREYGTQISYEPGDNCGHVVLD